MRRRLGEGLTVPYAAAFGPRFRSAQHRNGGPAGPATARALGRDELDPASTDAAPGWRGNPAARALFQVGARERDRPRRNRRGRGLSGPFARAAPEIGDRVLPRHAGKYRPLARPV